MTDIHLEKILIIDADNDYCEILENTLALEGFRADSVYSGEEGLLRISERRYQLVILDLSLPDISGMQVMTRIKEMHPDIQIIVVTAADSTGSAIESLKAGAADFISKPIMLDDVVISVKKLFRHSKKEMDQKAKDAKKQGRDFIGTSNAMAEVLHLVERVSVTDSTVLLTGESGTGKEVVAHKIFEKSLRNGKPFVKISCAALPETLLESELFGYMKGAFTGAVSAKKGLFEIADGGTLFLDEVSEVSPGIQAKLLRALQEKEIMPLGSTQTLKVDVRFIAATNKNLKEEIERGRFREDLYYRLNVINIVLPPLRDRVEDIPALVNYFMKKYTPKTMENEMNIVPEVLDAFKRYRWSGNIRELENIMERALILATGSTIGLNDIPERIRNAELSVSSSIIKELDSNEIPPLDMAVESLERDLIMRAMRRTHGNVSKASKLLAIKRTTLIAKMKKLGLK